MEAEADFLLARVAATPHVTLSELREALWRERGVRVAVSTLWRFFGRRRTTLKETAHGEPLFAIGQRTMASGQERADVKARRLA